MVDLATVKAWVLLAPIVGLLLLGSWVTVGSGLLLSARGQGVRIAATNFSRMLAILASYVVVLVALQRILGVPWPG